MTDETTVDELKNRIDDLEARLAALEGGNA